MYKLVTKITQFTHSMKIYVQFNVILCDQQERCLSKKELALQQEALTPVLESISGLLSSIFYFIHPIKSVHPNRWVQNNNIWVY